MSDEFDKEAEREKLRKKFAEDEEKRSETQRMSELLLQGATMTNQHCDNCGDPLFRDDGQTFCPTCRGADGEAADQRPSQGGRPSTDEQPEQAQEPQRGRPAGTERRTDQSQSRGQATAADEQIPAELPENAEVVAPASHQDGGQQSPERRRDRQAREQSGAPQPPEQGDAAGDPRAELRRAVTETARNASAATDPRTARAWLEASKEAAEALAALEQ